jgi:hypothetical protein
VRTRRRTPALRITPRVQHDDGTRAAAPKGRAGLRAARLEKRLGEEAATCPQVHSPIVGTPQSCVEIMA